MFDGNVSNLIASLKRRASIPTRQNLFDENDFLAFLTEEMQTEIVPTIVKAREDFYLTYRDFTVVPLTSTNPLGFGLENFGLLPFGGTIPITWGQLLNRSIGTRIKDLHLIDQNGNSTGHIPRITLEDISSGAGVNGFYYQGNDIVFFPAGNYSGKFVRIWFYRLPNRLVQSSECARVVFVNYATNEITVDNLPNASWTLNFELDIIQSYPGYESILDGAIVTNITGTTLTLDKISQKISAGDWVSAAGYACVAQIPETAYPLLSQLGSIKFLEAFGRQQEMQAAQVKYAEMKNQFQGLLQPRVELAKKKLKTNSGIWNF
ncbi:MAG TPA: hypothetical protein PKZ51_09635 [Saprospiraceae bacterium]|nr:hypothetical protein [Saprospiraceae bacterium]